MDMLLIQGQQPLEAGEICPSGVDPLLLEVVCQNIQHHVLSGNNQLRRLVLLRRQQGGVGVNPLHRTGGMLMPGAGNVGIHVVLGKAHLAPDLVGVDFSPADQVVDGGLADVQNIGNLLGG